MKKLWQKNWKLDTFIESFETKDDLLLDQKLVKFDVYGSMAHAKMLAKIGILSKLELTKAIAGLLEILELSKEKKFKLESGDEDVHSKIENFLTEKYGDVGKKIHTGRSRNDQVLTDLRLFSKEHILYVWKEVLNTVISFHAFARKYEFIPMPGYTHTQKAMPSSVGMWASSFVESFIDDLSLIENTYLLNDQSPLGSAAGYGVPLNLDREFTAKLLGFKSIQINSLYCQNSRGKIEGAVISSLISVLSTINKFATDVLLFTSTEFNYFNIVNKFCSGSSIMPQKKNVDIAELLRSKVHIALGNYQQVISLSTNLPSGYNRDLQDTKKPLIESLEITQDSIKATNILINNMKPKVLNLTRSLTPEIFATHYALDLVAKGTPFREAYQIASNGITDYESNLDEIIKKSTHIGGTGNLCLTQLEDKIKQKKQVYKETKKIYQSAIKNLIGKDKHYEAK